MSPELVMEDAEKALFAAWGATRAGFEDALARRDYLGAARRYLDGLGKSVHEFMAKVYVNVEDQAVKRNRLSLLRELNRAFAGRIADLAKVVEGKKK